MMKSPSNRIEHMRSKIQPVLVLSEAYVMAARIKKLPRSGREVVALNGEKTVETAQSCNFKIESVPVTSGFMYFIDPLKTNIKDPRRIQRIINNEESVGT